MLDLASVNLRVRFKVRLRHKELKDKKFHNCKNLELETQLFTNVEKLERKTPKIVFPGG